MSEITKRGGAFRAYPLPDTRRRNRGEKGRERDRVNTKSGDRGEGEGADVTEFGEAICKVVAPLLAGPGRRGGIGALGMAFDPLFRSKPLLALSHQKFLLIPNFVGSNSTP